mmetsp:Transcript_14570/g.37076  ORF Transcript_14570/g.37076 Transcript_14570/m.37076 type:complete len:247 (+) Transcript_14570:67-807(+)|eukprot:CAMPEP_0115212274 /NCGR_PEP_ID=MMETSP0270-20121206/23192_1 /TAXON_ID=71861 /ORGANISM="Scrippsiella trochoidea, Strain CCMP3099" /LENGTH=246 /DNA_ID=CAMNT_0002625983 /DNA_START=17 /DNA_END=757 /DNA_ORIENTATION=-
MFKVTCTDGVRGQCHSDDGCYQEGAAGSCSKRGSVGAMGWLAGRIGGGSGGRVAPAAGHCMGRRIDGTPRPSKAAWADDASSGAAADDESSNLGGTGPGPIKVAWTEDASSTGEAKGMPTLEPLHEKPQQRTAARGVRRQGLLSRLSGARHSHRRRFMRPPDLDDSDSDSNSSSDDDIAMDRLLLDVLPSSAPSGSSSSRPPPSTVDLSKQKNKKKTPRPTWQMALHEAAHPSNNLCNKWLFAGDQ